MYVSHVWKLFSRRISEVAFDLPSQLFSVYCHGYIYKHLSKEQGNIEMALRMSYQSPYLPVTTI